MGWDASTWWWVAAGGLVAAELATGTFYLLLLALGAAAGAITAHAGAATTLQIVVAAVVGAGATAAWYARQSRRPRGPRPEANPDVNPDIGRRVFVDTWATDGTASVRYRGAAWSARFAGSGTPSPGEHVIVAVDGNQLQLRPVVPA